MFNQIITDLKRWITIWIWILIVLMTWYFIAIASWTNTNPWTTDSSLFINWSGSLTKDKWNALVNNLYSPWASATLTAPSQWKVLSWRFNWYKKMWNTVCFNMDIYTYDSATQRTLWRWTQLLSGLPAAKNTFFGWTVVWHNGGTTASWLYSIDTSWNLHVYFWTYAAMWVNASWCYETN